MAKKIKKTAGKNKSFLVKGSLWIERQGEPFFGPGPAELLERINDTGSINQAARQMNMSYKKAWEIINMLNSLNGRPYVITQTGGSSGGGSVITEDARAMIKWYRQMRGRFDQFLSKEAEKLNNNLPG